MAWEWVAPVGTAAVGAIGIVVTGLTAWGGRRHAETIASSQMTHERELAAEARRHSRIAEAYVDALDLVAIMANFVSRLRPLVESVPPPPVAPLPSVETQAHVDALMLAFAGPEVLSLYETWRSSVRAVIDTDQQIEFLTRLGQHGMPRGDELTALMHKFGTDLKPDSETARQALVAGIAKDLGSRSE